MPCNLLKPIYHAISEGLRCITVFLDVLRSREEVVEAIHSQLRKVSSKYDCECSHAYRRRLGLSSQVQCRLGFCLQETSDCQNRFVGGDYDKTMSSF